MILESVVLHNFGPFQGTQEINLSPGTNSGKNILLIGAKNGSGKTKLLEALKLCLYGEKGSGLLSPRESERAFISSKFNYNAHDNREREMYIELRFENVLIPDPHRISIRRTWYFDTVTGSYENSSDITLLKDGKELELVARDLWQDFVNQKIPPGVADFFFFDGEKIQELADDTRDKESLKDSITNLLGLKIVDDLEVDLQTHIEDVLRKTDKVTDSQLTLLEAEESAFSEQIQERQDELIEINDQLAAIQEEEEALEFELRRITGVGTSNRNQLELELAEMEAEKRKANEEILKLASDILPFAIAGLVADDLKRQIMAEEKLRQWEAAKERVHPQLNTIVNRVFFDDSVDRLKPDLTPHQKVFYAKLLTDEWESLFMPKPEDAAEQLIHGFSSKDERFVMATLDSVSREILGNLKDLLTIRERAARRVQDTNRELRNLPEDDSHIGQMVTDFRRKSDLKKSLSERKGKIDDEIVRFERDRKSIQEKIENLKGKLSVAKAVHKQVALARKIRTSVQDYQKKLQATKLSELEQHTTEMYKKLARKRNFVGEVRIDRRTFDVSVHDEQGKSKAKKDLSAGEKQIYAISLLWGLAKSSDVDLPIVVDTPFARLDGDHRTNIAKYYFPLASKQVIILSTDEEIDAKYVQLLEPHISSKLLIEHSDIDRRSTVINGYFF